MYIYIKGSIIPYNPRTNHQPGWIAATTGVPALPGPSWQHPPKRSRGPPEKNLVKRVPRSPELNTKNGWWFYNHLEKY